MAADMADTKEISQGDYVVCVHHGADLDGWTSAALVQRWAKENNMQPFFFPMNYNAPVRCKELMEAFRPKYLIVADYSLTPDEYQELDDTRRKLGVECEFIWCDHHISAVRDWHRAGLLSDGDMQVFESGYQVTIGEFQDSRKKEQRDISLLNILLCKGQSGCRLLHKMLFPEEYILPSFVFYVDRYDVWDLDPDIRPDAEALQLACKVYDVQNPASDFWKEVIYQPYEKAAIRTEELIQEGRKYAAYQEKLNETAMEALSFTVEWHGHTWLAANITGNSQVADSIFDPDIHDGVLLFSYTGYGDKPWKVSMYNHRLLPAEKQKSQDFSTIAKEYGGGGHPGACGFRCAQLPFLP